MRLNADPESRPPSPEPGPPPRTLADETVVARVLQGDLAAFELIMRRYNRRLFRTARAIVRDDDEAEDVVQDAYVRAYEHLAQFQGRSRFSTWLTRIVINEASARRRRSTRISMLDPGACDAHATDDASAADASRSATMNELGDLLSRAVDALPPDLRTVFVLRAVEGLDTEATADCLELTTSNVKVRLHRARERLRTWIDSAIGAETRRIYQFGGKRCDRLVGGVFARLHGR